MTKRSANGRMSIEELDLRRYHKDVRTTRDKLEAEDLTMMSFKDASPTDVCILSPNDYELGLPQSECDPDNESYFISPFEYQQYLTL